MDRTISRAHRGSESPAFAAINDAVLAIAGELSLRPALQKIVDAARDLVNARYSALGVPDDEGSFAQFITSGMTSEQREAIGPLPKTHGLLGAMLKDPKHYRIRNIGDDTRFRGWPEHHPRMRSFLGVPIVSKSTIIGAFYLTDKRDAPEFTDADRQMIELLAAHAAIAIENARLFERSRELSVVEERNRLARDLHDSVSQTLFSMDLTAEAAATLVDRNPAEAKAKIWKLQELGRDAVQELRSLIFELRPAQLEEDGLVSTLQKHIGVLKGIYPMEIDLHVNGERPLKADVERQVFAIAQEALNNALKHSRAKKIMVELDMPLPRVALTVRDDGAGFDPLAPAVRSQRLGLTSMQERAEALGGSLRIDSSPGKGTQVILEIHVD